MRILIFPAVLLLSACATYQAPGAGAGLPQLAGVNASVRDAHPEATFPARVLLARVQDAGYATTDPACRGAGRYCVLADSPVLTAKALHGLQALPQVASLQPLALAALPANLNSIDDLRSVAAAQQADLLLVYTIDTRFTVDNAQVSPQAVITPGFMPNKGARVTAVTTSMLIDVRSGFVYGDAEATSWRDQNAMVWATRATIEDERRITERASFELWQGKFAALWNRVVLAQGQR